VHGVAPAASGALAGCRRLQRLDLAGNRLEDVSALRPLTALTLLGVEGNRLATLHGAPPMPPPKGARAATDKVFRC